jgi:hypothetical protein
MVIGRVVAVTVALGCFAVAGFAGQRPAQAGPPFPFYGEYDGLSHHNSSAQHESENLKLTTANLNNGNFTGQFGPIPITGTLNSSDHKITFSGQLPGQGGATKIKDGKGQLSATGLYCVGTFRVSGSTSDINGAYTFGIFAAQEIPPVDPAQNAFGAGSGGITTESNINSLLSGYSGSSHHNTLPADENEPITLVVTQKKPNGSFRGALGVIPITGHVDAKGRVSFKGGDSQGGDVRKVKNGSAQLSAQGNFLLGSFKLTGTGIFASDAGGYTFETAGGF